MSTAVREAKRYAAMMDVTFRRKPGTRQQLEKEIVSMEKTFSATCKLEHPAEWFDLQDKLGVAYRKLMELAVSKRRR